MRFTDENLSNQSTIDLSSITDGYETQIPYTKFHKNSSNSFRDDLSETERHDLFIVSSVYAPCAASEAVPPQKMHRSNMHKAVDLASHSFTSLASLVFWHPLPSPLLLYSFSFQRICVGTDGHRTCSVLKAHSLELNIHSRELT